MSWNAREEGAAREGPDAPFDPALPGLALLSEPPQLTATLSRVLPPWLGPEERLLDSRAHLHHLVAGKRCTVEVELLVDRRDGGPAWRRRLLGKVYQDGQGATVCHTLQELRSHGLGAGRFLVPRPLVYLPDHRLLLLSWADGEPLRSVLLAGADAAPQITGAAQWLLALGHCGIRTGRRYSFRDHLRTLAGWKDLLAGVYPQGEHLLSDLLARFEERSRDLPSGRARPTHRDFSPEHMVVGGDLFTALDFDEFCQYDPLFDVAHFIAHLRFLGLTQFGNMNRFDALIDRFLAAYEGGGGDRSEERLSLYEAVSYFKLGRFVALVPWSDRCLARWPGGWREILPELLSAARRRL